MSIQVIVQTADRELGGLIRRLLEPFRYETHVSATTAETSALARRLGPVDLVLVLDHALPPELRERLREVSPDLNLLHLPPLLEDTSLGDAGGTLLETTELMELIEGVITTVTQNPPQPAASVDSLRLALVETILTFTSRTQTGGEAIAARSRRAMAYAVQVSRELGLSATHVDEVAFAALLQDVGLEGGHDADTEQLLEHPNRSAEIVRRMKLPWRVAHIVRAHHEAYDGLGYPQALRGREIPLGSRIVCAADAYVSLLQERPGSPALAPAAAIDELRQRAGRQLDPEVVEVMLEVVRREAAQPAGSERRPSLAIVSADAGFASLLRIKFEASRFSARILAAGMAAIEELRREPPDGLLVDVELEDMSGFQLLHWMKQDERLRNLPLLVVSGEATATTHAFMAHDMGADDFLTKPIRPSHLVARLNAVLRRRDRLARAARCEIHPGEGLRGSLAELPVAELVAMLVDGRKTATVALAGPEGDGEMSFDSGLAVHARTGELRGEEAFRALYRRQEGSFRIEHGAATAERTIARRMDLLLAEAAAGPAATAPATREHGSRRHRTDEHDGQETQLLDRASDETRLLAGTARPGQRGISTEVSRRPVRAALEADEAETAAITGS